MTRPSRGEGADVVDATLRVVSLQPEQRSAANATLNEAIAPLPKVAIIHDWLYTYGGAERVLEELLRIYPHADLFTTVDFLSDADRTRFLGGRQPKTSFIQKMPKARTKFRAYLPFMPLAIEQFDLSSYELVISSSYAVAKGVLTGPDQLHVSYVHSPIRYAWDLQHQYLAEANLVSGLRSWLARIVLHFIRIWDSRTANGVDVFLANSAFIGRRVRKAYGRQAKVVYPPVDTTAFQLCEEKQDFYLTASRLVSYKKIPLIVEAFARMPDKKLVVIGDGEEAAKVKAAAKGAQNIELMGYQSFEVLRDRMRSAKAFVFAAEEDFGITPVEAQACGTPVIAYGKGGILETIRGLSHPKPTGLFFIEQTAEAIIEAVQEFERDPTRFQARACRENAERFAPQRFRDEMEACCSQALFEFRKDVEVRF